MDRLDMNQQYVESCSYATRPRQDGYWGGDGYDQTPVQHYDSVYAPSYDCFEEYHSYHQHPLQQHNYQASDEGFYLTECSNLKQEDYQPYTNPPSVTKNKLRDKIQTKRPGLVPHYQKPAQEQLSAEDMEKRKLRRERNKEAAQRCRQKKRAQIEALLQEAKHTIKENRLLLEKVELLQAENKALKDRWEEHQKCCTMVLL